MVLPSGIEPDSSDLQTVAMTTSAKAANWSEYKDLNLGRLVPNQICYRATLYSDKIGVLWGIEPSQTDSQSVMQPLHQQHR